VPLASNYLESQRLPYYQQRALRRPLFYLENAMQRVAVFVDAGYFWVQTANVIIGQKSQRPNLEIDYPALRKAILDETKVQFPNASFLRVYWYDGPGTHGKTADHRAIEEIDDFKLRLGTRNGEGAQKAVDGLIIADMISLAQTKAITDALLLSGDADLAPGVIAAQNLGIRVHLLSMGPVTATSPHLRSEADFKAHWKDGVVKQFAKPSAIAAKAKQAEAITTTTHEAPTTKPSTKAPAKNLKPSQSLTSELKQAVEKTLKEVDQAVLATITSTSPIPSDVDRKLLSECRAVLGRALEETEKRGVRHLFKGMLARLQKS